MTTGYAQRVTGVDDFIVMHCAVAQGNHLEWAARLRRRDCGTYVVVTQLCVV